MKKKYIITAIVVIITVIILCIYYRSYAKQQNKISENSTIITDSDVIELIKFNQDKDIYTEDANEDALNIIEYGSFTCNHCANLSRTLHKIKKKYKGKVRIIYRSIIGDLFAFNAVKVLDCIKAPNATKVKIVELIYKTQSEWIDVASPDNSINKLISIIEKTGVETNNIKTCIKNPELDNKIINNQQQIVDKLAISAVPLIIVGDKKIQGGIGYKHLNAIVKKQLR